MSPIDTLCERGRNQPNKHLTDAELLASVIADRGVALWTENAADLATRLLRRFGSLRALLQAPTGAITWIAMASARGPAWCPARAARN